MPRKNAPKPHREWKILDLPVLLRDMPNVLGLEAAKASLEYHDSYVHRAWFVCDERERVVERVKVLGYAVLDTQANFYCLPFAPGAHPFAKAGIHIRGGDTIGMPGYVRITLGTSDENDAVLDVLKRQKVAQ